jgi:hypothetical protein
MPVGFDRGPYPLNPARCLQEIGDKRLSGVNPAGLGAALAGEKNQAEAASM